jgi:hypothetical protein
MIKTAPLFVGVSRAAEASNQCQRGFSTIDIVHFHNIRQFKKKQQFIQKKINSFA